MVTEQYLENLNLKKEVEFLKQQMQIQADVIIDLRTKNLEVRQDNLTLAKTIKDLIELIRSNEGAV